MLELHLNSGDVVTFDGRIVEVFGAAAPSRRFHVSQLGTPELTDSSLSLASGTVTLPVAGKDAPMCKRLLAAIADAHAALRAGDTL